MNLKTILWVAGSILFLGVLSSGGSTDTITQELEATEPTIEEYYTPTEESVYATPYPTHAPTIYEAPEEDYSNSGRNNDTYTNSRGNEVQSPGYYDSAPAGASAQCGDGTYSFSQSRRGTCSHHGGVVTWL